jgi:DNA-binding SARP family transcriptional activator
MASKPKLGERSKDLPTALRIELLGRFRVTRGALSVGDVVWARTHARRLVQFVGSQRRGVADRAELLSHLWPGSSEQHSVNRLHHTIHLIRRALAASHSDSPSVFIVGPQRIEFAEGVTVDVVEFEHCLAAAQPDRSLQPLLHAIDLYQGDLIPDWAGAVVIDGRRTELRNTCLRTLKKAAAICRSEGKLDLALRLMRRFVAVDPYDSDGHMQYAELLFESGSRDSAVAYCKRVRHQLSQDVDDAAAQAIDLLAHRLLQRANQSVRSVKSLTLPRALPPNARPTIGVPINRLFGCEPLIRGIRESLEDPSCSVVNVCGPPGIGKTSAAVAAAVSMQEQCKRLAKSS